MKRDDAQLLRGCLGGNAEARDQLVRRFSHLIYSTIMGTLNIKGLNPNHYDIDDLHNHVIVQLFDRQCLKLRQFKGKNGCSLASWIRMLTVRATLDHLRRNRDALAHPKMWVPLDALEAMEAPSISVLDALEAHDRQLILERAIESLPPRDRLMIRMHCLEGCSLKKMAAVLNVTENNVHSVKHRAVQKLKKAVEKRLRKQ
jgi:RNA polymerase sigma-70 factor (ECF subfamily)